MPAPTTTKRDEAGIMWNCLPGNDVSQAEGEYHGPHRSTSCPPCRRRRARVRRGRRARGRAELGTNEIARRTGINASTVSRLLATLAAARFVEHVPETGRYAAARARSSSSATRCSGASTWALAASPHSAGARPGDGRDGDAVALPGEQDDRRHCRLRPQPSVGVQSVAQLGRPSCRVSHAAGKVYARRR